MNRFLDWLEDYYIHAVMLVTIAVFAFGGIVSRCDKQEDEATIAHRELARQRYLEIRDNREAFYEKYCNELPQFASAQDFSMWIDDADVPSFSLLHDYIMAKYGEYMDEDGYIDLVDYLGYE